MGHQGGHGGWLWRVNGLDVRHNSESGRNGPCRQGQSQPPRVARIFVCLEN